MFTHADKVHHSKYIIMLYAILAAISTDHKITVIDTVKCSIPRPPQNKLFTVNMSINSIGLGYLQIHGRFLTKSIPVDTIILQPRITL